MQTLSLTQLTEILNEYQYYIVDRKVYNLHLQKTLVNKSVFFLDDPESCKSIKTFEKACDYFLDVGIKRKDTLICIGGGATTDLGGFVASSLLRGINWIAVPTTLLSMIDASIGGKVGINTKHGKNLLGSFHLPEMELISLDFLESLDHNQIDSGKGELIKYAFLSQKINTLLEKDCDYKKIIKDCIEFKKEIVLKDFKELGLREILNYGHTFGHGFEKLLNIEHGMAVAIGIQLNIQLFSKELINHFSILTKHLGLNLKHQKVDIDSFLDILEFDKKNISNEKIRFVIVDPIGKTRNIDIDRVELKNIIKESESYDYYFL